jgi:Kynureninase
MVNTLHKKYKPLFYIPKNWIYLDGNSLGPLTKNIKNSISKVVTDEWGEQIIKGWNKSNWMTQPDRIGNVIAKLIGASKNTVTVGDTLAIKLFQAISGAHQISKKKGLILSDKSNFPSDLYIANSYLKIKIYLK